MATARSGIRVAIVDDDVVLRDSLEQALRSLDGIEVIGAVGTLGEAMALSAARPTVFFVDLALPDGEGFKLLAHLKATAPDCRAIVVTVFGDAPRVVRAIELGADGYLLKDATVEQLAGSIDVVLAGGAPLSPAVAALVLRRVQASAPTAAALVLTPREHATLEGLAKGLSFKELGAALGISHHTVGDHVKAIYRKLQVNSRGEAIYEAARSGLIRLGD
ncbi:MAG: response regulator transcription factor [Myxococcaceae bacterium]|nr:response regulator transcription factor [Myxococcaceae bacterium]